MDSKSILLWMKEQKRVSKSSLVKLFLGLGAVVVSTNGGAQDRNSERILDAVAKEVSEFYDDQFNAKLKMIPVAFVMDDISFSKATAAEQHVKTWLDHYLILYSTKSKTRAYQMVERNRVDKIWDAQRRSCAGDVSPECAIELGNNLAASSLIFVEVFEESEKDTYLLSLKIANAENGGLDHSLVRQFTFKGTAQKDRAKREGTIGNDDAVGTQAKSVHTPPADRMGPRLGIGLSTQSVGGLFRNTGNLMPGPLVGWFFDLGLLPQLSFMPEILYMSKGFAFRNPVQQVRTQSRLNYVEVPLLLKIGMDKEPGGMFLLGGPTMGYFLGGTYKQWVDNRLLIDGKYQMPPNGRRFQFSALVGMGMEGERWGFDVRAQTSITPFERFTRIQNVVYAITLAYRMGGNKDRSGNVD